MTRRLKPGHGWAPRTRQRLGSDPKRRYGFFRAVGLVLFLAFPALSFGWEIESFDADLAVQADGSLQLTETIWADFQGEERHGIYRDIPLVTQDRLGLRRSIRLGFQGAQDEEGRPWPVKLTREGAYRRIRLGSPGVVYRGRKLFQLSYHIEGALRSFPDHDELYWNATGNSWSVPIRTVSATVRLPPSIPADQLKAAAYSGAYGSTAGDARIQTADGQIRYEVSRALDPFEGLTVVAGWPPGVVRMPTPAQRCRWFLLDNWALFVPLIVLFGMGILWWRFGRDLPRAPVNVQYDPPPGLTPAEAGTLLDDRADLHDVTATLIDLARRGHLHIEELGNKEYRFTRQPKAVAEKETLKPHEQIVLTGLFFDGETVSLSELENKFYQHLPGIRSSLYKELTQQGYWWGRPDSIRMSWQLVAVVLFVAGGAAAAGVESWQLLFSAFCSALILAAFAPFMPRKTWQGARAFEKILGLQEFLRRTDEDRLRRESDPAALFERMLPYAMAFGVANQWARAFEGLYQVNPAWYTGPEGSVFTPADFSRRIEQAGSRMGAVLTSAPRSSDGSGFGGGGFSGGGGGGGGGGAW